MITGELKRQVDKIGNTPFEKTEREITVVRDELKMSLSESAKGGAR